MATTVMDKWGHGIYVWMKRFQNILKKMRFNINTNKNKERKYTKRMIAARHQQKKDKITR